MLRDTIITSVFCVARDYVVTHSFGNDYVISSMTRGLVLKHFSVLNRFKYVANIPCDIIVDCISDVVSTSSIYLFSKRSNDNATRLN